MRRAQIYLIDLDERYLMPLEHKLAQVVQDKADINVITDRDYLSRYFSVPRNIDLLIISEKLLDSTFERHEISYIFVLTEQESAQVDITSNLTVNHLYKYTSMKEIFLKISSTISGLVSTGDEQSQKTKVITVYSPVGGIGKTTISFALCNELSKLNQSVLYIGTDSTQSFGYFYDIDTYLAIEKQMINKYEYISEAAKPFIVHENFDIMPPFFRVLSSIGIGEEHYIFLIRSMKRSGSYDFIVVDTDCAFTKDKSSMLASSDYVLFICGQDMLSIHKLDGLLSSIDCSDSSKFLFICNKYIHGNKDTNLRSYRYETSAYISYTEELCGANSSALRNSKAFEKLAFLFV